jgi:GNAT superfamily N-acetyltransferase
VFFVSTDKSLIDRDTTHQYLSQEAYWCQNLPLEILEKAIDNSVCFGVYQEESNAQVGFARVITDEATFAYLCDVFILPTHQGQGLGKLLMQAITEHLLTYPLRNWSLATRDAHGLYEQYGFVRVDEDRWMQRKFPDIYAI